MNGLFRNLNINLAQLDYKTFILDICFDFDPSVLGPNSALAEANATPLASEVLNLLKSGLHFALRPFASRSYIGTL